jgi:hypothetical protein
MALPWLQIVQMVPSIVDVSRELLRKTKRLPENALQPESQTDAALIARVEELEENERRQAELISQMAEQIAKLTRAITTLHNRTLWLGYITAIAAVIAASALIAAIVT